MSSPLDSPDVPITCSGGTFQSSESLALRRQVRLTELSSNQFNDLFISANPHFALMHTLLASPEFDDNDDDDNLFPDTPSANVTPSVEYPLAEHAYLLEELPQSPSGIMETSTNSNSEERQQDIDYIQFYDEFWQMTKFEYELQCISSSDVNSDSQPKSDIHVDTKF